MAPPTPPFPASSLESRVQYTADGKKRHPPVDLANCALKEMVQYKCNIVEEKGAPPKVECEPIVRLFRKCQDGLTVETTVWEG
ncbi:hypothetical protein GQ43DRAFT_349684, partial [Delitschia confertaspora ATCC 74209]